ncbi:MAG: hypothetical protein IPM29_21985 [Planctomycetes bacterium]|nr:hypothetical protein [Planctomycetota bacterium]
MRWGLRVAGALGAAVSCSCGGSQGEVGRVAPRDELRLELGGEGPSIRDVLHSARRATGGDGAPLRIETPRPEPPPPPPPPTRVVHLAPGQTLSSLCRAELGDPDRWREVMELNGWSEADLFRLAVGTPVRLPVRGER